MMILIKLFFSFLRIGLFAIGGAYSFLPLIEKETVDKFHWLTKDEFLEVLGIVKIFPGAISIKFATYTGYKVAGVPGAVVANIANMLSPMILIFAATYLYNFYKTVPSVRNAFSTIQLVVFAMIMAAALQMISFAQLTNVKNLVIIVISFVFFMYTKIHPAFIIIGAGLIGAFL